MTFKDWLMTENNNSHIKKIDIFDFDDTLFKSPSEAQFKATMDAYNTWAGLNGKEQLPAITGKYWHHPMSLSHPIVPEPTPIKMAMADTLPHFFASARDPQILTVVMTGRPHNFKPHVERILKDLSLKPDRLYTMDAAGKTHEKKIAKLKELIDEFPHVEDLEMWDDRGPKKAQLTGDPLENHIKLFRDFFTNIHEKRQKKHSAYKLKFKLNEIPPRDDLVEELKKKHPKYGKKKDKK